MNKPNPCDPNEIALKSFFLGPQAENGPWVENQVIKALQTWFQWRQQNFAQDGEAISQNDKNLDEFQFRQNQFATLFQQVVERYKSEMPKYSPRYIGHMFSEISLPAFLGHLVTLMHNPNNISGESSVVGVQIENEAIQTLNQMLGYDHSSSCGHFTSGGTVANFEAVIRAKQRSALWLAQTIAQSIKNSDKQACEKLNSESPMQNKIDLFTGSHHGWKEQAGYSSEELNQYNWTVQNPWQFASFLKDKYQIEFLGPVILVPENKHYSWKKAVNLVGLGDDSFWPIELNASGKLDVNHLQTLIEKVRQQQRPILMVVSVAGTTEMGEIDPIDEVQDVLDQYASRGIHIWHHIDAAYGGFFRTLEDLSAEAIGNDEAKALDAFGRTNSITIDPHKLGYVPYSCGAILVRDEKDYAVKTYSSPYIQYSTQKDKGLFTLEGSRSAAGATATWLTARSIGLNKDGYGRIIKRTIDIRKELSLKIKTNIKQAQIVESANTNILCLTFANTGNSLATANKISDNIYAFIQNQKPQTYFVSKTKLHIEAYDKFIKSFVNNWQGAVDCEELVLLRLCIMNPFINSKEMKTNFTSEFIELLQNALLINHQ